MAHPITCIETNKHIEFQRRGLICRRAVDRTGHMSQSKSGLVASSQHKQIKEMKPLIFE